MQKAVFLDRDGTINFDHGYVYETQDLQLLPGSVEALRLLQEHGYLLIVVTNQSGVGRGYFSLEAVGVFNEYLRQVLRTNGVTISEFFVCPHTPEEQCVCRKPLPYMIHQAIEKYDIDPSLSFMIGDKQSDVQCGRNAHVRSLLISPDHSLLYWAHQIVQKP